MNARNGNLSRPEISLIAGLVALLTMWSASVGLAQTVDATRWVTNGLVKSIVTDGSTIYVAGYFTHVGPATGSAAAIDASTGAVQQPYPRVSGTVSAVAPDGSGGWYLGGSFSAVRGQPRNNLAQLDSAGNLTSWNPNANNVVSALVVSGGTVYVGGDFTSVGGATRNRVAALDSGSGAASAWNPNADGFVRALWVSGSTVYAGGGFANIGGQPRNRIAALDATTGAASAWDPNANNAVLTVTENGGTVYVGGQFTNIGGQARSQIAALDAASGATTTWNPDAQSHFHPFPGWPDVLPPEIDALAVNGSTVYVGGFFDKIGGLSRNNIAAVDAATGAATSWNPNSFGTVRAIVVSGGTVYACGDFTIIGGQPRSNVAALDASTGAATPWTAHAIGLNLNLSGNVVALAVSGGRVYAGGDFNGIGAQARNSIAALDATTGAATAWNPNASNIVRTLAVSGGVVYAGGSFSSIGGQPRSRIAALDATTGVATTWNPNAQITGSGMGRGNLEVNALLVSGGTVYAGGSFSDIGGQPRNNVAAIDAVTGAATAWDPNVQWPEAYSPYVNVYSLALNGGTVYIGGQFNIAGGLARNNIAAIDATTGAATPWNPDIGPNPWPGDPPSRSVIYSLAVSGSTVYAGGRFFTAGAASRNNIAAIDASTGLATAWNPNSSGIVGVLALSGGMVYVGGSFANIGGQARNCIAALDAATGGSNAWNPNANSGVTALVVTGGEVYAGGAFTNIGGLAQTNIAAISRADTPVATLLAQFVAATSAEGIELRWSFGDASIVATVGVERALGIAGPWLAIAPVLHDESGVTVALDRPTGVSAEYFYRLVVQLTDGGLMVFGPVSASSLKTPFGSDLSLVSPNPTSGGTQVQYGVARAGRVRLEVLDVSGRVEETLADGIHATGRYVVNWDGVGRTGRLSPGLHFVRLVAPDRVTVGKLAIIE